MKPLMLAVLAAIALASTGCTISDTEVAQRQAHYGDKPAHIVCYGYHGVLIDTMTTGRIEFDTTGRIDFVDAKTGRLTKVEGECIVTYNR